ncbi:MAG: ATP synthase F1 subunit epsilon [Coriobacteriia bacterium]|nr:ATP synthase F1 subunit epsilon [Coriobacteriia bacterium]
MTERTLMCEIVTPERIVYTNEVRMVVAPAIDGEVGVLPLHAPLVSALRAGEVRVRYGDGDRDVEWFAVSGGYIQVHEDKVIILADHALAASQIDVERAKQALDHAQTRMAEVDESAKHEVDVDELDRELKWCEVQLEVGRHRS